MISKNMNKKIYELLKSILQYLATKPYVEVWQLITGIQNIATELEVEINKKEKDENTNNRKG
jgi:hypothetical protein